MSRLTLADIADQREYDRWRDDYRHRITALKKRRRVALGPVVTLVFESVDTVRFQIQEMARAERITTDAGIEGELDIYNALLPTTGELSATLFIELTSDAELRYWLPRLVGIERAVALDLGPPGPPDLVRAAPEADHAAALSRPEVTAAVHYLRFAFDPAQQDRLASGAVALVADHDNYRARTELGADTVADLLGDLRGDARPVPLDPGRA